MNTLPLAEKILRDAQTTIGFSEKRADYGGNIDVLSDGINDYRRTFQLEWKGLSLTDITVLRVFFAAHKTTEFFIYKPCDEITQYTVRRLPNSLNVTFKTNKTYDVKVTLIEDFTHDS